MVLQGLVLSLLVTSSSLWAAGSWLDWIVGAAADTRPEKTSAPVSQHSDLPEPLNHAAIRTREIQKVHQTGVELARLASELGYRPTDSEMLWRTLLEKRVIPQSLGQQALIVAFTGPTKTGKSTTLNRVAGAEVAATGHLAGLTKQSTLLAHPSIADTTILAPLFPSMTLVKRSNTEGATLPSGTVHYLEIEAANSMPVDFLYLDTPDFDSNETDNWEKARLAAQTADVIVAMISPDKHGDEVVREFYSSIVAASDKPVVLVINKVHPKQVERGQWKEWLRHWCVKTGIQPIAAYVVPFDIDAAESQSQDFFKIEGDLSLAMAEAGDLSLSNRPVLFSDDLRALDVPRLKKRANAGSLLQALEGSGGFTEFLQLLQARSEKYGNTLQGMDERILEREWPTPPHAMMQEEIERWWNKHHRTDIASKFQGYAEWFRLGAYIGTQEQANLRTAIAQYSRLEDAAIDDAANKLFDELNQLLEGGSEFLSPSSIAALGVHSRASYLTRLKRKFSEQRKPEKIFAETAEFALPEWAEKNPTLLEILKLSDNANSVVLRPIITLASTIGGLFAPHFLGPAWMGHNFFIGVGSAGTGGVVGERTSALLAWGGSKVSLTYFYTSVGERYAAAQLEWVHTAILNDFLDPILGEIKRGKAIASSPAYQEASACMQRLLEWAKAGQVVRK